MRSTILQRAFSTVRRMLKRNRHEGNGRDVVLPTPVRPPNPPNLHHARPARREPDVPFDQLAQTYIPKQTSLKASFRATGEERQRDQEFGYGMAEGRWREEDRFTNRSGDPRIGTHGRTYEPGE